MKKPPDKKRNKRIRGTYQTRLMWMIEKAQKQIAEIKNLFREKEKPLNKPEALTSEEKDLKRNKVEKRNPNKIQEYHNQ